MQLSPSSNVHIVCVLQSAKRFTNDISKSLALHNYKCHISYIKTVGTKGIKLAKEIKLQYGNIPKANPKNSQMVFIIDDLIDSGNTAKKVKEHLVSLKYNNIKMIAIFNKYKNNIADIVGVDLDYNKKKLAKKGVQDYWLYGYGMDLDGKCREINEVRGLVINKRIKNG